VDIHQLAPDEPLSPELVLVLPPELRAQALARLGAPSWPTPPRRTVVAAEVASDKPLSPSLGAILVARIGQLALVFIVVTILVLAMSLVAQAMRSAPQTRPVNKAVPPGRSGRSDSFVERYRTGIWTPG
jgi:Na+-transporting methylmalonyl-CoA/oxaloacetate decarboxylase gamma subunit